MTLAVAQRDPRTMVPPAVWDREVRLIMRDHDMDRALAERTFDQTVAYLVTSAAYPDITMGPTPAVDKGVHSFTLDTRNYTAFCDENAGRYIHHIPHLPGVGVDGTGPRVLAATIAAIRTAGFDIDAELWDAKSVDCNQCYAGCADSPKK